jgi:hypothetical protein
MTNQSKINDPKALPQESGTLSGKHALKLPYVALSFTITDVALEPFCGDASVKLNPSYPMIEEELEGGTFYDIEIIGL